VKGGLNRQSLEHLLWGDKMNKILHLILLSLFSLTILSCSSGVILNE